MMLQFSGQPIYNLGYFTYRFSSGGKDIFIISYPLTPLPMVDINCMGQTFHHDHFDPEVTVFEGIRREIYDDYGCLTACFQYETLKQQQIITNTDIINIEMTESRYEFYYAGELIALITPEGEPDRHEFRAEIEVSAESDWLPYILATPFLKFM